MAGKHPTNAPGPCAELAEVRDALAGIAAVAALLAGADPAQVDRTAVARLIEQKCQCAALKLEQVAGAAP